MVYDSFNKNQILKEKINIWECFQYCSISFTEREAVKSASVLCLFYAILGLFLQFNFFIAETDFSYSPSMSYLFSDNNMTGNPRVNRRRRAVRAGRGYPPTFPPPPGPRPATVSPW